MRKILKFLTGRMVLTAIFIILEAAWLVFAIAVLRNLYPIFAVILTVGSLLTVVWATRKRGSPTYKMAWCILILGIPILGILSYLLFGHSNSVAVKRKKYRSVDSEIYPLMQQEEGIDEEIEAEDPAVAKQFRYVNRTVHYPAYRDCYNHYLSSGEEYFEELCKALDAAEKFIFMEYFIIERTYMWGEILNILERKVKEGVEVRVLYDDIGSIWLLPRKYPMELEEKGIQCRRFNTFKPLLSAIYNNRDHRKMTVIDGDIVFCGGVNLADEYINKKVRCGHWKDGGVLIKGEAVWNFTCMYLSMWNEEEHTDTDYLKYKPGHKEDKGDDPASREGYVAPYGDTPLEQENVSANVYLNIIHNAQRYVYIYTPYLIVDYDMMSSLILAAKNGVDVRIMTPHIPDKKMIFMLTRSYYGELIDGGVKIYEYEPGFVHTKAFIADDKVAAIGSINLDFRSLYLHFECGSLHYKTAAVAELKEDFLKTLHEDGFVITKEFCKNRPLPEKIWVAFMSLMAPLF